MNWFSLEVTKLSNVAVQWNFVKLENGTCQYMKVVVT